MCFTDTKDRILVIVTDFHTNWQSQAEKMYSNLASGKWYWRKRGCTYSLECRPFWLM